MIILPVFYFSSFISRQVMVWASKCPALCMPIHLSTTITFIFWSILYVLYVYFILITQLCLSVTDFQLTNLFMNI